MTSGEHTKGHTGGRWSVIERKTYFGVRSTCGSANSHERRLVAVCAKPHSDALANANLIVTAVNTYPAVAELVKALEAIEPFIPQSSAADGGPNARSAHVAAADQVRSALTRFREAQAGGGA